MKFCDLTQFYSPHSGGVKRYVGEKVRFLRDHAPGDQHILIIPGERDECIGDERARTCTIASPLLSMTSRYRVLLRLEAIERILEREQPDLIESGDPYQVAWKAVYSGAALRIPVVGFYHSHFPEAYVRTVQKFCGRTVTEYFLDFARRYVRNLYNRFERTLVPSPALGALLADWGVRNIALTDLGVDAAVFQPEPQPNEDVRRDLGIPPGSTLLLYVGRLAQEKNTQTLFAAFRRLSMEWHGYHLLVVGDGLQRADLHGLMADLARRPQFRRAWQSHDSITWLPYCSDPLRLATFYRAADLFVHPGVQETFGLVALEAQACGTPVVGIRGSYMDRIVHNDQTLWAAENSPEALAAAIRDTVRQNLKRDRIRLHRNVAARYSWEKVFTGLFAVYRQVIAAYHAR